MIREINNLRCNKLDIIFVPDQVYPLLVIHDEERLNHPFFHIILDALRIRLKCNEPAACKCENFFTINLVGYKMMEAKLENFLCIARALCIEDLFVVATHDMPSKHGFWLANYLEDRLI